MLSANAIRVDISRKGVERHQGLEVNVHTRYESDVPNPVEKKNQTGKYNGITRFATFASSKGYIVCNMYDE